MTIWKHCGNSFPHDEHEWFSAGTSLNDTLKCAGVLTPAEKLKYRKARKEFWPNHPRVRVLKKPVPCEGIKHNTVAMKDIYSHGPGNSIPARGIQEKSKCKRMAHWHFTPMKNSMSYKGNFCWSHLFSMGLYGDPNEMAKTESWANLDRNRQLWRDICARLGIKPERRGEDDE